MAGNKGSATWVLSILLSKTSWEKQMYFYYFFVVLVVVHSCQLWMILPGIQALQLGPQTCNGPDTLVSTIQQWWQTLLTRRTGILEAWKWGSTSSYMSVHEGHVARPQSLV